MDYYITVYGTGWLGDGTESYRAATLDEAIALSKDKVREAKRRSVHTVVESFGHVRAVVTWNGTRTQVKRSR